MPRDFTRVSLSFSETNLTTITCSIRNNSHNLTCVHFPISKDTTIVSSFKSLTFFPVIFADNTLSCTGECLINTTG